MRRSRVCLLRGVWPLLCGAVLRDGEQTENEKNRLTEGEKIPYSGFTSGFALDRPIQPVCTGGAKQSIHAFLYFSISAMRHGVRRKAIFT
ncbi:MAG TPA: hypothetical protein VJ255_08140 [Candidatus Acidoferrum sp.]|nr:hypothetical protein [Candidatus Acidoferrum sp.]